MTYTDNGKSLQTASCRDQIFEAIKTFGSLSGTFFDEQAIKGALSALQRGPIRFQRNSVIACESDAADYVFLVASGVHKRQSRRRRLLPARRSVRLVGSETTLPVGGIRDRCDGAFSQAERSRLGGSPRKLRRSLCA